MKGDKEERWKREMKKGDKGKKWRMVSSPLYLWSWWSQRIDIDCPHFSHTISLKHGQSMSIRFYPLDGFLFGVCLCWVDPLWLDTTSDVMLCLLSCDCEGVCLCHQLSIVHAVCFCSMILIVASNIDWNCGLDSFPGSLHFWSCDEADMNRPF